MFMAPVAVFRVIYVWDLRVYKRLTILHSSLGNGCTFAPPDLQLCLALGLVIGMSYVVFLRSTKLRITTGTSPRVVQLFLATMTMTGALACPIYQLLTTMHVSEATSVDGLPVF